MASKREPRQHLRAVVILVGMALVAGCAPSASPAASSSPGNLSPSTGGSSQTPTEPTTGGTAVAVLPSDPSSLAPNLNQSTPDIFVSCMVYEGLVRVTKDLEVEPNLASSWEISPDGLTYTFQLVEASWSDGEPFTAKDVAYTWTEVSPNFGSLFATAAKAIESIDTPDDRTVVVHMSTPFAPFLSALDCGTTGAAVMPEHIFAGTEVQTNPAATESPVGTGPFVLDEWARGDHLTFVRNPNYWQEGRPYLDSVIVRIIPTAPARTLALRAGEVHEIDGLFVQGSDIPQLATDGFPTWTQGTSADQHAVINVRREPYNDPLVRQALLVAVDREFLATNVFSGNGSGSKGAISPTIEWAHDPSIDFDTMYPYDPEKAASLLDDAGHPVGDSGYRFPMDIVFDSGVAAYSQTAQALASMWRAVGLEVRLVGLDRATAIDQVYVNWDFDVAPVAFNTQGDPALGIQRLYLSSGIGKQPFLNGSGYSNPEVDDLFEQAQNVPYPEERAPFYHQVEAILANDLPTLPLVTYDTYAVGSPKFHGLDRGLRGSGWWGDAWLEP